MEPHTDKMSQKKLKKGFTTGAAAAAAVKAALTYYFQLKCGQKQQIKWVDLLFLNNETRKIDVHRIETLDQHTIRAIVIKDAGDDPDVTHKAEIGAEVTVRKADKKKIIISGGKGVGTITKPGLELPVGEPAINPGPRKMITQSVDQVLAQYRPGPVEIEANVFVPHGEALAEKTLNKRLGIIGGISILGTTGIVTPLSHDAYIATIRSSISVAAANQIHTLVFTTGRRSERFAMEIFCQFNEEAFVQTGDFFKASVDMAMEQPGIQKIIYTVFFGKAVKMAMGFEHTHAAKSELTLTQLSKWADEVIGSKTLSQVIAKANTARHAFSFIHPQHPKLIEYVGNRIKKNAMAFSQGRFEIRTIIFDFDGNIVFDSKG